MKIKKIKKVLGKKLINGTLPDIDIDFSPANSPDVEQYMHDRFGKDQICYVGTYNTFNLKGLMKDLLRLTSVDFREANLITSIIPFGTKSMQDLFKVAAKEPKLKNFLKENSDIVKMMPRLLYQPKTKSIHPCSMVTFPNAMSAVEWSPMRKQDGFLVSEWNGEDMADAGFLKDDVLKIRQLLKFDKILSLIKENGKEVPNIYNLEEDSDVYRYFSNGWNCDVFQMGGSGMMDFNKTFKPRKVEDLIAINALYRPGTMENGYHTQYADCKNKGRKVEYLWGTEEITKDTYGLLVYQEQIMRVFTDVAGRNDQEADDVRRAMGKKKLSVLLPWKDKVEKGFLEKGCSKEDFEKTWSVMMEFSKYSFNKSHSAAYAMTAYICQYLKVHFPIEFWTVALEEEADELKKQSYLAEIANAGKINIKSLDINKSGAEMIADLDTMSIYWGISSIKGVGVETAKQIINERIKNGKYNNLQDFLNRNIFTGSKVKKTAIESLIACGAFDELHEISEDTNKRMDLLTFYRTERKVKVSNTKTDPYINGDTYLSWWWMKRQKELTGMANIDYREICISNGIETPFASSTDTSMPQNFPITKSFGGYVIENKTRRGAKGKFSILTIENNHKLFKVIFWNEAYDEFKDILESCEKSFIIFDAGLRYSDKYNSNQFTVSKGNSVVVL